MLNKKEVAVMKCIYGACKKNDAAIISDETIIENCPQFQLDETQVDTILKQLEYDGYFENTKSDKNGQTVNVVTLKQKGKAFEREMTQRRRELVSNALWRVAFAVLGALVTLAISKIFG